MNVRFRLFVLLSASSFLATSPARAQQTSLDVSAYSDETANFLRLACEPSTPAELRAFKERQIGRRSASLEQAIAAMKSDAAQGDLRFLFGTAFDLGCLLQKVGVNFGAGANAGGACDTSPKAKQ